jgi:phage terminase large subunit-like protein
VDYEYVAKQLADILAESDCEVIGFDRWRIDVFKKECDRLDLVLPLQPFGQGYKDMSPALDKVEELLLNNRLAHGMHPVLTMCAANAAVSKDPAGNRKLDKQKVTGRIDGMVALTMAIGAWSKSTDEGAAMMGFLRNPVTA